ncbi:MAG: CehA/McbA family metallohydrolase [Bacteroidetes bacterium]|nr:CehA/McbA family metallohydrolase [Bacteroidota bacterium]
MKFLLSFCLFLLSLSAGAQRVPVLPQIDLPHNYYFRELYLPQLTTGPSSVAWMPDGKSLVYSMGGSLWRQVPDESGSVQLTDDIGYDYQPDVSPDGKMIAFVRYNGAATELMMLNVQSSTTKSITANGAVNLEPRWSPDGKQLAFVSTHGTGHFLLYIMDYQKGEFSAPRCITPDRKSAVKRYYYSAWDHAINPAWSHDAKTLYFVSNREVIHGTGDLVALNLSNGDTRIIRHEETSWQTKPDLSPDGTRIVYSSYLGNNWHQLWITPSDGGYPIQLTYGDYDNRMPRWSPDGQYIAFISNRSSNTSLWIVNALDGSQRQVRPVERRYLQPHLQLDIIVRDESGKEIPARVSVTDARGKSYAPDNDWMQADDSRYPDTYRFEYHYFHTKGRSALLVPGQQITIKANRGPGWETSQVVLNGSSGITNPVILTMKKIPIPGAWWTGDVHLHMNYGGHYKNTPERLIAQAKAEDLNILYSLVVNKEQRIPDVNYFNVAPDALSDKETILVHSQEFHTSFWGHLGLLSLKDHLILPGYVGYSQTAVESLFPNNASIADRAHAQKGLVGYVHPFEQSDVMPEQSANLMSELPIDAALGKVDYYEVIGFADHIGSAYVWHHMLNCGLRIPAAAGTDAMANYASLRGPVGLNRVYVKANGDFNRDNFEKGLKAGQSFVTNGPLLSLTMDGKTAGDSIALEGKPRKLNYSVEVRSDVPVDRIELVYNGRVIALHNGEGKKIFQMQGAIQAKESGWILLRAWNQKAQPDHYDLYPYATTNPVFLMGGAANTAQKNSAAYLLKWVERIESRLATLSFRDDAERAKVMKDAAEAKDYYSRLVGGSK